MCYPIIHLHPPERDILRYLRNLESVIIKTLSTCGNQGEQRAGATGVWTCGGQKKIASIGVAMSAWVTYHGCAINVSNDLSGFSQIQPCGFSAKVMTSLKEQLADHCPSMDQVKSTFTEQFLTTFQSNE